MAATVSNPGFVLIFNDVILDPTLSAEAKATFGVLTHFDRGRGCFCKKETLAVFTKLSLFRLRKALRELEKSGRITIQSRKMGMTDLIRIVSKVCVRGVEEPIINEPTFEQPELEVEEPWIEPPQLEIEAPQIEAPEPEPEAAEPPLESAESQDETPVSPAGNDCHSKGNKAKNTSINTPYSYTGRIEASPKKEGVIKEVIDHFFQLKERRPAAVTETKHWSPVASQLLQDFTVEEIKGGIDHCVHNLHAKLFYFIGLAAPSYIHSQRKSKERDIEKPSVQEPPRQEQHEERQRQIHREERRQSSPYKAETRSLLEAISQHIRPQSYNVWFSDLFIAQMDENLIVWDVCSQTSADFIERKYGSLLQEITGKQVKFVS